MTVKVFLWTAPRCISTAFERSIREVARSKVFHEPLLGSYYFGPERQSRRYADEEIDLTVSYKAIEEVLTREYDADVVFTKNMAYYMDGHYDRLLSNNLREFHHTFLIRNRKKSIPSLYRASLDTELTGWDYFEPQEAGFKEMYDLFNFLKEELERDIVVVDADDLLMYPEETMKAYTQATGITYDADMLSWEPILVEIIMHRSKLVSKYPTEGWDYTGWHEGVMKSSGFTKRTEEEVKRCDDVTLLPTVVQETIRDSMAYYESLKKYRLNPHRGGATLEPAVTIVPSKIASSPLLPP